jgi:hypothetical protein
MVFKKLCCRYHPVRYDFVDKWNINSMSPNGRYHRLRMDLVHRLGVHSFFCRLRL